MQDIIILMQQHKILSMVFFIVLILLIIVEFFRQKKAGNTLSSARVTDFINHRNAVIIDVRSSDAYASGHIIGALSIPIDQFDKNWKKIEKFKSQPIVLVCATGMDSSRAAKQLQKEGIDVYILNGGLRSWKAEQLPLTK